MTSPLSGASNRIQTNSSNPAQASANQPALRSDAGVNPIDCSNPQTQQEMNQCALQSYEIADREMQAMYQQVQGQMSDTARSQIEAAQQSWNESRTAQCRLETKANEGGSLYPTVFYRCMERISRDRTKQLQQQLNAQS